MKVLITGANGFVGSEVITQLSEKTDIQVFGVGTKSQAVYHSNYKYALLNLTDGVAVDQFITDLKPDYIIHSAAISQPDVCEVNQPLCYNANVTATRFIIDAAKKVGSKIIFLSTDFVFDGEKGNYVETDHTGPVNYYGSTKVSAEKAVMESGLHWAIIRTVLVYGKESSNGRDNLISRSAKSIDNGDTINIANDQVRTPTYVRDLATAIISCMSTDAQGIFHVSGEETFTPYEMVKEMTELRQMNTKLVNSTTTKELTSPAKRPMVTGFDCTKAKNELNFKPTPFHIAIKEIFS